MMATSSFATGKMSGYLTPNSRHFGGSVVVEIGADWQPCERPSVLLLKLVLEVVLGTRGSSVTRGPASPVPIPRERLGMGDDALNGLLEVVSVRIEEGLGHLDVVLEDNVSRAVVITEQSPARLLQELVDLDPCSYFFLHALPVTSLQLLRAYGAHT